MIRNCRRDLSLVSVLLGVLTGCTTMHPSSVSLQPIAHHQEARTSSVTLGSHGDRKHPGNNSSEEAWSRIQSKMMASIIPSHSKWSLTESQPLIRAMHLAIQESLLGRAMVIADQIIQHGDTQVQAIGWNGKGMIYVAQRNPVEARSALENSLALEDRVATRLNLGNLYGRYGHFQKSLEILLPIEDHPESQAALVAAERHLGHIDQVDQRCHRIMEQKQVGALALFNCALHESETHRDIHRALGHLDLALTRAGDQRVMRKKIEEKKRELAAWSKKYQP